MIRTKSQKISWCERNIYGGMQGDCRRWEQIAEAMLMFLDRYTL
jgi:hypothetical protein